MNRASVAELKKNCLSRLFPGVLASEHVVFSKMLYRSKNQHRHDLSFQKMTGVSEHFPTNAHPTTTCVIYVDIGVQEGQKVFDGKFMGKIEENYKSTFQVCGVILLMSVVSVIHMQYKGYG